MYTQADLSSKYKNVETKIPGIWKKEMFAAMDLQTDLTNLNSEINDTELIIVINLMSKHNTSFFTKILNYKEPEIAQVVYQINIDDKLDKLTNH